MLGPFSAPSSPPETPVPMKRSPGLGQCLLRRVSRKCELPASMTMSPRPRGGELVDHGVDRPAGLDHDEPRALERTTNSSTDPFPVIGPLLAVPQQQRLRALPSVQLQLRPGCRGAPCHARRGWLQLFPAGQADLASAMGVSKHRCISPSPSPPGGRRRAGPGLVPGGTPRGSARRRRRDDRVERKSREGHAAAASAREWKSHHYPSELAGELRPVIFRPTSSRSGRRRCLTR